MSERHHRSPAACQHINLAQSEVGEVGICQECGVVHVSLQAMSVRFRISAFQELAQMLAVANARLDELLSANMRATHHPDADTTKAASIH